MSDATANTPAGNGLEAGEARPFGLFERRLAVRYLRARKEEGGAALIAILAFVGIALAAFGLLATMSVFNGFNHIFFSQIIGVQPHAYVQPFGRGRLAEDEARRIADDLRATPGVVSAELRVVDRVLASHSGITDGLQIIGMDPSDVLGIDLIAESLTPQSALADFADTARNEEFIIVGCGVAVRFALTDPPYDAENPCGVMPSTPSRLRLITTRRSLTPGGLMPRQKTYSVVGVFRTGNTELDSIDAYMPLDQAQILFNRTAEANPITQERINTVDQISVRVDDPMHLPQFLADARQRPTSIETGLRETADREGLGVRSWRDIFGAYENALRVERTMIRIILAIVVVITAMNIITGLVMLSKNKARDIAILRTMGATRTSVLRIFLMIGALIGILGTVVGLILGALFATFIEPLQVFVEWVTGVTVFDPTVYPLARLPARMEWGEVVFVGLWGIAMSCLAALPPAWNAARVDPVETLRNE